MARVEGRIVRVGDWVGFKSDIEQYGQIAAIKEDWRRGDMLTLKNENGFQGEYILGHVVTEVYADDCWLD